MACRRCGSSWCTKAGKDKASCPECCKQQLCKARKQGLLPASCEKACKRCGESFVATHANAVARQLYCDDCKEAANTERIVRWKADQKTRKPAGTPVAKKKRLLSCMMCGSKLANTQKKYCCLACYNAAKKVGLQSWDRSKIDEAARVRPSNIAQSVSRWFPRQCRDDMAAFLTKVLGVRALLSQELKKDCDVCGRLCVRSRKRLCSRRCARRARVRGSCCDCGIEVVHNALRRVPLCSKCERKRKQKFKNRLASNHRKRCRKYGLPFDSSIKSQEVFRRDNYVCHICKRKTLDVFTLVDGKPRLRSPTVDHHPYPLSAGVLGHTWDNVRCACWECNTAKGAKWSGQLPLPLRSATGSQT